VGATEKAARQVFRCRVQRLRIGKNSKSERVTILLPKHYRSVICWPDCLPPRRDARKGRTGCALWDVDDGDVWKRGDIASSAPSVCNVPLGAQVLSA
jgi:hypothetical protein